MNFNPEQLRATTKAMLEFGEEGFTWKRGLKKLERQYLFGAAVVCVLVLFIITSHNDVALQTLCYSIIAFILGAFLRDFGWLRAIKKNWPVSAYFTDWAKVEATAAEALPKE